METWRGWAYLGKDRGNPPPVPHPRAPEGELSDCPGPGDGDGADSNGTPPPAEGHGVSHPERSDTMKPSETLSCLVELNPCNKVPQHSAQRSRRRAEGSQRRQSLLGLCRGVQSLTAGQGASGIPGRNEFCGCVRETGWAAANWGD